MELFWKIYRPLWFIKATQNPHIQTKTNIKIKMKKRRRKEEEEAEWLLYSY